VWQQRRAEKLEFRPQLLDAKITRLMVTAGKDADQVSTRITFILALTRAVESIVAMPDVRKRELAAHLEYTVFKEGDTGASRCLCGCLVEQVKLSELDSLIITHAARLRSGSSGGSCNQSPVYFVRTGEHDV